MKTVISFFSYVFKTDKRIKQFLIYSVLSSISQYTSLGMLFVLIKIQVSSIDKILDKFPLNSYFIAGDINPSLLLSMLLFFLAIFYIIYSYFSFISKKYSMEIIATHKDNIKLIAERNKNWQQKEFRMLSGNFFELYTRFFQVLQPMPIMIVGFIFISFFNYYIPIFLILALIFAITLYHYITSYFIEINEELSKAYLSSKRKLIAQIISILLFIIMLAIIFSNNFSIEITVVLIIIGRILLGNFVNFLHFSFEILAKLGVFNQFKNEIVFGGTRLYGPNLNWNNRPRNIYTNQSKF